ncbi:MAG: hypothetical protein UT02_C0003G0022 [Parcubacteria group bacterium GW2011_GWC2_38_7]|nr:MAG: hypothetical protein UT02_C0003G0022 [Parcubacteria group bacterium GW2011_GWC2_38_7]
MDEWSLVILTLLVLVLPSFRQVFFRKVEKKEETKVSERIIFFDILKGISMLAVILIHVTFLYTHTKGLVNNDLFINVVNNISRFAIAFFFICSGILLNPIKNKQELKNFYSRKLIRIILPYFLVSMFLFFVHPVTVKTLLYQIVTGQAALPFYFVIVLIQMYLLYPLISRWRHKKWFLPVMFFISLIYFVSPLAEQPFGFPIFFPFLFLFAYGVYFRDRFLNYQSDKQELWGNEYYYNQRYFYGPALFNVLFFFRAGIMRNKVVSRLLLAFGKNSLWIFLIHFPLMLALYPYILMFNFNYYLTFLITFIISIGTSYLLALICQMIYNYVIEKVDFKKSKV